jgi:hypothetical protein
MTEIHIVSDFPQDIRPAVEGLLARYAYLLPTWCLTFVVRYKRNEKLSGMVRVEPEYRRATLYISGAFVRESAADRENTIAHELLHVALWPMYKRGEALIEQLYADDEPGKADYLRIWNDLNEAAVCDLALSATRVRQQ